VARAGDVEVTLEPLSNSGVVVRVEGDLDMATSPRLEEALESAGTAKRVVIDLTECTFLDSSALRLLIASARARESEDGSIELVVTNPRILRVLEITAVDTVLPVHDSLESAL
jgi:anti-sigma B factor antagonist